MTPQLPVDGVRRKVAVGASLGLICIVALAGVAGASATGGTGTPPPNIAVTPNDLNAYSFPWLASDPRRPRHLAIGYGGKDSYLALSSDGGTMWRNLALAGLGGMFRFGASYTTYLRPIVAFAPRGTLYAVIAACQCAHYAKNHYALFITSTKDGRHFTRPTAIDPHAPPVSDRVQGQGDSEPRIAVDQRTGWIYVTWVRYAPKYTGPVGAYIAASGNGGRSFSAPVMLNVNQDPKDPRRNHDPKGHPTDIPTPAVGPDGTVYVAAADDARFNQIAQTGRMAVILRSSHDHGKTFGRPSTVAVITHLGCEHNRCNFTNGEFSAIPGPFVPVVGRGGRVFVTWSAETGAITPPRIFVARSHDGGRHWSRQVVPPPAGKPTDRQLRPWASIAPNGRLDIVYYDITPDVQMQSTYSVSSRDNGRTFSPATLLSSAASSVKVAPFADDYFSVGEQVASANHVMYAAWTDNRRGTPVTAKTDIYFTRVAQP
jgi:hypothetical protein